MLRAILAGLLIGLVLPVDAAPRSKAQRSAFVRENPCPETGVTRGACPGLVVDHVVPLCAGGADHPDNMQWMSVEEHKEKTRRDVRLCRLVSREK